MATEMTPEVQVTMKIAQRQQFVREMSQAQWIDTAGWIYPHEPDRGGPSNYGYRWRYDKLTNAWKIEWYDDATHYWTPVKDHGCESSGTVREWIAAKRYP